MSFKKNDVFILWNTKEDILKDVSTILSNCPILESQKNSYIGLEQHDELVLFLCRNKNRKAICSATVTLFEHWLNP